MEDLKTPKGHFKINWSLRAAVQLGFFRWVFALTRALTRLQAQRGEAVPPSPHHCAGDPSAPPPPTCCLKIAAWVRCYSMACKHAWWLWFVYEPKRGCQDRRKLWKSGVYVRVGKTVSLGPWSRVIVYCSKLSFFQNDPLSNLRIILAKGKLATINYESVPRSQRSCFAHPNLPM